MRVRPWAIGAFLIVGFAFFAAVLFLIGNRHKAFTRHTTFYAEFADMGGLTSGAKVRVSGFDAGQIKSVSVPEKPSGKFRLELQVEDKVRAIIRKDSVASIQTEGVVGDKFISIKKGSDETEEANAGMTLPSKEPFDFAELMEKGSGLLSDVNGTIKDVRGRVDGTLDSITRTVNQVDGMVTRVRPDIQKMASDGSDITANINAMVEDLENGKGTIGLLLRDDGTRRQLQETLSEVNRATNNIGDASARIDKTVADVQSRDIVSKMDATIDNVQSMSAELNTTTKDALAPDSLGEDGAANLRQTLSNLNRGTSNIADDSEALKHNFLLRGFFKRRGYYDLDRLTPERYRRLSDRDSKAAPRQWLQASSLVTNQVNGGEELSESGRKQIDAAVAPVVDSLPESLVVVEGYSDAGSPDEQFVVSRRRADLVRRYLELHFHLRHDAVAIEPLRSQPPKSAGRDNWDGAAIVLIEQKSK